MRHPFIGIVAGAIGVVAALWPQAAEASDTRQSGGSGQASIIVRTYTPPDSERALRTARRTAGAILGLARVDVTWLECGPTATQPSSDCTQPLRWNELVVRVVPTAATDPRRHVTGLGVAFIDVNAGSGSLATVYADRVRMMAGNAG